MARTLDQKIAEAEARLNALREENRKLETGQKIILGGMLLNAAEHNTKLRNWVLEESARSVTRDIDKKRLAPLLEKWTADIAPDQSEQVAANSPADSG